MLFVQKDGTWTEAQSGKIGAEDFTVFVLKMSDPERYINALHLDHDLILACLHKNAITLERKNKIDYIGIFCLSRTDGQNEGDKICICMGDNLLVIVQDDAGRTESMIREAILETSPDPTAGSAIFVRYLEKSFAWHIDRHEQIEDSIAALENDFLTTKKRLEPGRILLIQKQIRIFKRYYEQLLHVLDELQETRFGMLDERSMRGFRICIRRLERLSSNILVLREYVNQVRESYEAETDISLNNIMRIFTVVTVIFLPLTLIVGWYGMNFDMPEYRWTLGYPFVIAISLGIILFTIIFFKKNKWF